MAIRETLVALVLVPVTLQSPASAADCAPDAQATALEEHFEKLEDMYCDHWLYDCECVSGLLPEAVEKFQAEMVATFERGCAKDECTSRVAPINARLDEQCARRGDACDVPFFEAMKRKSDFDCRIDTRGNEYFAKAEDFELLKRLGFSVEAALGGVKLGPGVSACAISERLAETGAETLECLATVAFDVDALSSQIAKSTSCRSREKARKRAEGQCQEGEDCECIAGEFSRMWVETPLKPSSRAMIGAMTQARLKCRSN